MKKYIVLFLAMVLLLTACSGGDVSETGRRIGTCEHYGEGEIADAMDVVEKHFKKNFDGCKLINLEYDEEKTADKAAREAERCGQETIILLSSFRVEDAGDGSLNPGQTYTDYEWTLVKTFFGWELKDSGYA